MTTNEGATGASIHEEPAEGARALGEGLETQANSSAVSNVTHEVADEARKLAEEARQSASMKLDEAKDVANSQLNSFATALRAASDQLSTQTGPAAELVSHAASGLEALSRSIDGKTSSEMLELVRRFGRENPFGFIAGSILAGFAIGRVAATATSKGSEPSNGGNRSYTPNGLEDLS